MPSGSRRPRARARAAVAVLMLVTLGGIIAAAHQAAAAGEAAAPRPLVRATPSGTEPLPGTRKGGESHRAVLRSRVTDPKLAARAMRTPGALAEGPQCAESIDTLIPGVGEDDFLEETVDVFYDAIVGCNYFLSSIYGVAGAYDRSPSFNGQVFDGAVIGGGTLIDSVETDGGESVGGFRVNAVSYDGGRGVEPALELYLLNPPGLVWAPCGPLDRLRYLLCDGVDTEELHIIVGTGTIQTGLTRACRDLRAPLDAEQARLYFPPGGSPVSTELIRPVGAVKNELTAFKRDLCAVNSSGAAAVFAIQRGNRLWDTATAEARAGRANGDDRPLYWARVGMTVALSQWRPSFGVDVTNLRRELEKGSRGFNNIGFAPGARRMFVAGFDPFQLDPQRPLTDDIRNGNRSGAAAMRMDERNVGGANVETVVLPVRYADVGLYEEVLGRVLPGGDQPADLVVTSSQGVDNFDDKFELEYYNGLNRSSDEDNLNVDPPGDLLDPEPPTDLAGGRQFIATSLPVEGIDAIRASVIIDYRVREIRQTAGGPVRERPDDGPTIASISVEGSGGGFLSNELAYRATRLRDARGGTVPTGHIHIPEPASTSDSGRVAAIQEFESILAAAVTAPASTPVRLTVDRSSYNVGDFITYTVFGPPNTKIVWSSSRNGIETGENDSDYGHRIGPDGRFTATVGPWTDQLRGSWVKQVRLNNVIAQAAFTVN